MQYLFSYILIATAPSRVWRKSALLSTFPARSTKSHRQVVLFVVVDGWRIFLITSLKWPWPLDCGLKHLSWEQKQIEEGNIPSASTDCIVEGTRPCRAINIHKKSRDALVSAALSERKVAGSIPTIGYFHTVDPCKKAVLVCLATDIKVALSFWFLNINVPIFYWNHVKWSQEDVVQVSWHFTVEMFTK